MKLAAAALLTTLLTLTSCISSRPTQRGTTTTPDNQTIAFEARGQGTPTLILIHCWCGNQTFWKNQLDLLARNHEVITLDLPGHGESTRTRSAYTISSYGDDVAQLVTDLHLDHVILIGHSMGGPVALAAAAKLKGRVVGIIGIDNLHDADKAMTREMIEPMAAALEADFAAAMQSAMTGMLPKDADPALSKWIVTQAQRADHRAAVELMRNFATLDVPSLLRNCGTRVRCINSASSPWKTNVPVNRRYADFDAVVLSGVGHFPQLEKPELFNPVLNRTITELERAR